jgi:hypothetical protein|tara:strand:+ start:521 stop:1066 length:546 start_codon:yes stop_codon:yes gene_type:complete
MKKSFYRIGDQVTSRPWDRPTHEAISVWWESFKETKHLDQFEVWICGGALEGTETWDVDIILTGESKYPADLKYVLDEGIRIGFKHWLLVDIVWQDKVVFPYLTFEPFRRIRNFNEVEKQTNEEHMLRKYNGVEIYPGLYQQQNDKPTKSFKFAQKMIKEGRYTLGIQKLSDYIYNNKRTI